MSCSATQSVSVSVSVSVGQHRPRPWADTDLPLYLIQRAPEAGPRSRLTARVCNWRPIRGAFKRSTLPGRTITLEARDGRAWGSPCTTR
jgi:hypothetical protein